MFVIICMVHVYSVCTISKCYVFKFCKKEYYFGSLSVYSEITSMLYIECRVVGDQLLLIQ